MGRPRRPRIPRIAGAAFEAERIDAARVHATTLQRQAGAREPGATAVPDQAVGELRNALDELQAAEEQARDPVPRRSISTRSSGLTPRGPAWSALFVRGEAASAAASSCRRCSHSRSSPRATRLVFGVDRVVAPFGAHSSSPRGCSFFSGWRPGCARLDRARRAIGRAPEDASVGGKRERHPRQLVDAHARRHGDRHEPGRSPPLARRRCGSRGSVLVARSTISLQKPSVRPSMIVRVVWSKRTVATTTSCASRACASVRPTCAYSGSVKLPIGATVAATASSSGRARRWSPPRARLPSPAGPASAGRSRRPRRRRAARRSGGRRRPARSRERRSRRPPSARSEPGRVGHPADRHDGERGLGAAPARRPSKRPSARRPASRSNARWCRSPPAPPCPAARKAAATAADTSSSSVGRMRGPAWKSWTREPKAVKIEATCAPVAPAPITSMDGGTAVRLQASLWVAVSSEPGTARRRLVPPVQRMNLSRLEPQPALGLDGVAGDEARAAGVLADGHAQVLELLPQRRVRAHVVDHLAHARRAGADSPASARSRRCHTGRAGARREAGGRRGPASAPAPARHWPPCRRTPGASRASSARRGRRRAARRPRRPARRQ